MTTRPLVVCLLLAVGLAAHAQEMTVQNDSLSGGASGTIQAGFDPPESAAVWLTSPCDGDIVAVQVFWRSTTGVTEPSIEDSIKIFQAGVFPTPGAELASIDGPVMNDGVFNEFRFLDENQVIPLNVPVIDAQTFVVSFRFLNDPDQSTGPSLVNDTDGCQAGRNAIDVNGLGWLSSCLLGVTGDWVIRAVVDCETSAAGPGSVPNGGDAPGTPLTMTRLFSGDLLLSWGASCSAGDTDYEVYEGFMGAYYSHFSKLCSTGGATTTSFAPDMFDRYYLVVPTNGAQEGSYGRDGAGTERPQGGGACQGTQIVSCPLP